MDKLMKKVDTMDSEEREKLRALLREGKSSEKMDWMYKADKPDMEEYLLGRRIDKHVDNTKEEQEEAAKDAPGALFSEVVARRADLDMQAKMREDPLYAIRCKEEEARRRLLQNPIKMKQLEKVLKQKEEEKKKKKKKKKKHKQHKRSSDSDESSEDDEIMRKYLAIVNEKKKSMGSTKDKTKQQEYHNRRHDSDSEDNNRRDNKIHKHKDKHRHRHDVQSENSDVKSDRAHNRPGRHRPHSGDDQSENSDEGSDRGHHRPGKHRRHSSDGENPAPKAFGLIVKGGTSTASKRSRSRSPVKRSRSPARRRSRSGSPKRKSRSPRIDRRRSRSPPRKKLTAEEMERKRCEMMDNAQWRDEQRAENVKRYREEDDKEKEAVSKVQGNSKKFIKNMMMKHASQSSVEDRLKRNRYNIQRTNADLERSFTKR